LICHVAGVTGAAAMRGRAIEAESILVDLTWLKLDNMLERSIVSIIWLEGMAIREDRAVLRDYITELFK
jgi:hypothetical protein